MTAKGKIRIGIGGWTYKPWRGTFYPADLVQKRELEFSSGKLTSIEVNGTYYGSQSPESFARWHDETPKDFVFALKGPRFTTNRRVLAEAGESIERFVNSGIAELKDKLGPINWQFATTKQFDAGDFGAFLKLLPASHEGRKLRHAVEVRHDSFRCPEFVDLAREHGVAVVVTGDSEFPLIPDPTAPFVYARIMGTTDDTPLGYTEAALDRWAAQAKAWAHGNAPHGLAPVQPVSVQPHSVQPHSVQPISPGTPRDVYLYVISGFKERNPLAARALIERMD